ncbi:acyl-CoA reductase [Pseudomonas sp. UFMG81]|uniref:acyl-CoA reductase n=1 Tax=Pseudomonas sp. UFMG81 TaxID=2745936 RepID=UPI00188EE999|nr:acyl-CoA reductase [Pseudomonas sp. UFMG81]
MYFIDGHHHPELTLEQAIEFAVSELAERLADPCTVEQVIACAERFSEKLRCDTYLGELDVASRDEVRHFCQADALRGKVENELGVAPFSLRRIDYQRPHFESWRALGVVLHITPANAPLLPFFAVVEGLLAGNINWLRLSGRDQGRTTRLLQAFVACDPSGRIARQVAVLPVAKHQLGQLLPYADGVSAWGGNASLDAIRRQLPAGCRWIPWGHKISFAWLVPDALNPTALDALADEVCRFDQQACSSPQVVFVDSDDQTTVQAVGECLALAMARRQACWPEPQPDAAQAAEITTALACAELEQVFGSVPGRVWRGEGWQIVLQLKVALEPSPLMRTILLRPLPRKELVEVLLPWRRHLQTCGLVAPATDFAELSQRLLAAGVDRVTAVEHMHAGYSGEPHDGVYALSMLARRVSVSPLADCLPGTATLDVPGTPVQFAGGQPIMGRDALAGGAMSPGAQLFFRSGGSCGVPKLAGYTYRDYQRQMQAAADGLFAAGLDPAKDRVLNLMYAGNLYGGLLSFFSVLEKLGARHYPMGGPEGDDYSEVARLIVSQGIDTLLGMPSTVYQLFCREAQALRAYGGIRKVLLGGEHMAEQQRAVLRGFGVEVIHSALYGSVDAGPLGYGCRSSPQGVFHLMTSTQSLEIVAHERDEPVAPGQAGRLLFTSRAREGQKIERYDIGDSGRWVPAPCGCGSLEPRFELLGRHGSLVRVGSLFINPQQLALLAQVPAQLLLEHSPAQGPERIRLLVAGEPADVRGRVLSDPDLGKGVKDGLLELLVCQRSPEAFERSPQSGKTPLVIDKRHFPLETLAEHSDGEGAP